MSGTQSLNHPTEEKSLLTNWQTWKFHALLNHPTEKNMKKHGSNQPKIPQHSAQSTIWTSRLGLITAEASKNIQKHPNPALATWALHLFAGFRWRSCPEPLGPLRQKQGLLRRGERKEQRPGRKGRSFVPRCSAFFGRLQKKWCFCTCSARFTFSKYGKTSKGWGCESLQIS